MLLPDYLIQHRAKLSSSARDSIGIEPFDYASIQPASYDLHLGDRFTVLEGNGPIDPTQPVGHRYREYRVSDSFMLLPGGFVLATTVERITLPANLAAELCGRSSLGRLGLQVHATAGFIDPGFSGHITLELSNIVSVPIRLPVGLRIAQLTFAELLAPAVVPYGDPRLGSKYQHQFGATPSRAALDREWRPASPRVDAATAGAD